MDWIEINEMDMYDPITKLKRMKDIMMIDDNVIDYLIGSFYAFDIQLQECVNRENNYYILDDKSIVDILKTQFSENEIKKHLLILDNIKMIYRFTVAKKFAIPDKTKKQYRLNSWGKEYYKIIDSHIKEDTEIMVNRYIQKQADLYREIVLEFEKTPLDTMAIETINEKLTIKVVF